MPPGQLVEPSAAVGVLLLKRVLGEAGLGGREREVGVENAQDLLLRGMGVAGGVGARRLVVDRRDQAEPRSVDDNLDRTRFGI